MGGQGEELAGLYLSAALRFSFGRRGLDLSDYGGLPF